MGEKVVLAYSGGLDTSTILKWLLEKGYDVVAYEADLGQSEDFEESRKKALSIGASKYVLRDVKERFVRDFIFPAIRANALYEGRYLMGTSLARPLTAQEQIEVAGEENAGFVAHGATGKGNDQVRFEMAYRVLNPDIGIIAPWKDPEFLKQFEGRDQLIEYAKKHDIPVKATKEEPWSSDENLAHISYEAGMLEDPDVSPLERMFQITKSPIEAPDKVTDLEIDFEKGNAVCVRDLTNNITVRGALGLFLYLNKVGGENGIGRVDMVESRYVGMKSRGVYEAPGHTILLATHRDLESLVLDREVMRRKDMKSPDFAYLVYSGFWFSPEMDQLRAEIDSTQENVTGTVRLSLYKGNVIIRGRRSEFSLYDPQIASMHEAGRYDPTKARGFIAITALRPMTSSLRDKAKRDKVK